MEGSDMRRLSEVFGGWEGYQTSLVQAIGPLSAEQLAWKPSEKVRSIGQLARHIAMGRINWFVRMKAPGSEELAKRIAQWDNDPDGNGYIVEKAIEIDHDAAKLVGWLDDTWGMIAWTLAEWTVDDLDIMYRHVWRGDAYEITCQWTVWRIMAHDIHHGGQIARILAERGIEAFELRALGGHIVSPKKLGPAER
jgi:uncharacterized damage-inducible protein DinB